MLSQDWVRTYAQLNKTHTNGHYIWTLCELSCEAVREGGGEVRRLAEACIPPLDTDTIYRRRNAWLGWQVFQKVPEDLLTDEHGVVAETHLGVRDMLSYSHFELVGRRFQQRLIRDRRDLATLLVSWATNQTTVRQAGAQLTELVGQFVSVRDDVRRLRRAAAKVLRHGDGIPLRLYRYASVVATRTWIE